MVALDPRQVTPPKADNEVARIDLRPSPASTAIAFEW